MSSEFPGAVPEIPVGDVDLDDKVIRILRLLMGFVNETRHPRAKEPV